MNVIESFIANVQTSKAMSPGDGALDHPTRNAQAAAMRGAPPGNLRADALALQRQTVGLGIVATVALHKAWAAHRPSGSTRNGRDGRHQGQQLGDIVCVGACQARRKRDTLGVADEVVLATRLAAIGWVRSSFFPPRTARTEELSTMARARSSCPRRRSSASMTSWILCHTPAFCQAARRRQHTVPEPQPICAGSMLQGIPLRSTNTIPVSTARSGSGRRPAYCRLREIGRAHV